MRCIDAILSRRSTRRFSDAPLDEGILRRVLAAGVAAPSAKNRQPWRFSVVTDGALRSRIAELMERRAREMRAADGAGDEAILSVKVGSLLDSARCVRQAPCTVFVRYAFDEAWFGGNERGWDLAIRDLEAVDLLGIGACIENMSLAATSMGVASLWNCDVLYVGSSISELLGDEGPIVAALVLGFAAAEGRAISQGLPIRSGRMPVEEVSEWH